MLGLGGEESFEFEVRMRRVVRVMVRGWCDVAWGSARMPSMCADVCQFHHNGC